MKEELILQGRGIGVHAAVLEEEDQAGEQGEGAGDLITRRCFRVYAQRSPDGCAGPSFQGCYGYDS